jgi:hypothetical protein
MFYALYNPATGFIRKCLEGPSADWASLNANEDERVIESVTRIDDSRQAVDVRRSPHKVIDCPHTPSADELRGNIVRAVQARLDAFAQSRDYENILSACTYASDHVPQFALEGRRAVDLRGQTWAALYEMLAEVESGNRPIPSGYAEIESELPVLSWDQVNQA